MGSMSKPFTKSVEGADEWAEWDDDEAGDAMR